jgi:hypothetical protein
MPVDPTTIAGHLYYLCDSAILRDFDGMSMMSRKEWDLHLRRMENCYSFGKMFGISGQIRTGIYYDRKEN